MEGEVGMREGMNDDGMAGTLPGDPAGDRGVVGEAVLRGGMLVRLVPDDVVPPGVPFLDEPFDEAWFDGSWFEDAVDGWPADEPSGQEPGQGTSAGPGTVRGLVPRTVLDSGPGAGQGWPPDAVPVVLWPQEVLREALTGAPGPRLARVVAEAVDLAGNLDPDHDRDRSSDGHVYGRGGEAAAAATATATATAAAVAVAVASDEGPGAGSGSNLGSAVLADLSDDVLGDLVTACGRLQSWAAGVQARIVAERAARETHPLAHNSLVGQVTSELVVTEPEAVDVVVRAESGTRHPTVIDALLTGRIDVRKAHTLLRSASQLTQAERAEAIHKYLPQAPHRTWKWLQTRLLAFAKQRHGAATTAKAAAQQRAVHLDRAENDMGWLSAYLPAPDAAAVWGVVDDMAHQLRHVSGENRTLSQLRADSLTGIITGRLLPADRYTHTECESGTTTGTSTVPEPGTTAEPGPRTNSGATAGVRANATDKTTAESGIGTEPGTTDPTRTRPSSTGPSSPGPDATEQGSVCTCGGRAPVQVVQEIVQEVVQPVRITPTRPVIRVTIPATALLGLDDAPGHLAGYGPIPAETARTIAQDATWQRLLTDPTTGILTDYSTTTYQPGKVLRTAVEARDETCTFLTCDTPASRCDLDHIQPFDHDHKTNHTGTSTGTSPGAGTGDTPGQTRAQNLQPLCRKHHLLKTHAGWNVIRDPKTGITTLNRPGVFGGWIPWKDDSHGTSLEVSAGAA